MDSAEFGRSDYSLREVILRDACEDDAPALESFDPGSGTLWLDELVEIVRGLPAWRDDPSQADYDRRVVVAEVDGEIVAVAAHERDEHERLGVLVEYRYLMVVAVRVDAHRTGLARVLTAAVLAQMRTDGVRSVR